MSSFIWVNSSDYDFVEILWGIDFEWNTPYEHFVAQHSNWPYIDFLIILNSLQNLRRNIDRRPTECISQRLFHLHTPPEITQLYESLSLPMLLLGGWGYSKAWYPCEESYSCVGSRQPHRAALWVEWPPLLVIFYDPSESCKAVHPNTATAVSRYVYHRRSSHTAGQCFRASNKAGFWFISEVVLAVSISWWLISPCFWARR